jgi:membrane fusion protein, copper/silver efflux system
MKEVSRNRFYLVILSLLILAGCNFNTEHAQEESTRYTCPMHPQIVSNEPGICPICKMELVPLSGHGQVSANDSLKYLVKPTNELVQASIATVKPQSGKRFGQDLIKGVINYNSNNWNSISSKISGRIERLYVKYNYQPVTKGQKIMDIYSPDLANAQQELLFLKQNGEPGLLEGAKKKLRLLGMTDKQIQTILRSQKVDYTISIYSSYSGYLAENAVKESAQSGSSSAGSSMITGGKGQPVSDGMGESASMGESTAPAASALPQINSSSPLSIREGQYVSASQKLFDLINASSVWAEFYLRPEQLNVIRRGTQLEVTATDDPSLTTKTRVSLVQPYYSQGSSFTVARALINNGGKSWRVGQLVNVNTDSEGVTGTWVPRSAVLKIGTRYVVFVKEQGGFKPVYVGVTKRLGDWVDIGTSLAKTTEIASSAWFLVDSESFVKPDSIKK